MHRVQEVDYPSSVFFQAEDGIRDLVRSRGLGDVYKRQGIYRISKSDLTLYGIDVNSVDPRTIKIYNNGGKTCLLYTSDAADERSSVDLGGRRIIKKKTYNMTRRPKYKSQNNRHNSNKHADQATR